MSAPKMYYAIIYREQIFEWGKIALYADEWFASVKCPMDCTVIPIPAHEIDNLIKKYRK